ncbi:glutaredoxin family protein [candidate division KSB1 bacterium]|nr:glutaredoxin family protein [candidate division KSB1 bacterium]
MYENEVTNRIPVLLALSTCPRCTRMKKFLEENKVRAVMVDVDLMSFGEKKAVYKFLQPYNPRLSFPTMIVGKDAVIGEDYEGAREVLGL